MPESPQDFELYSRVTGTPMPSDAMSRMRMAPDVYKFTKDFARKPNLLEKTGNLIKSAGRNTLVGVGLLAGMDLENQERQRQELMRNEASKEAVAETNMDESPEQVAPAPALTAVEKGEIAKQKTIKTKTDEMIRLEEVRAKLRQKNQEKAENLETYSIPRGDRVVGEGSNDIDKLFAKTTQDEIYGSQQPLKDPSTIDYISKKTGEDMNEYYKEKTKIIDDLDAKQESLRQQPTTADTYGQDYVANQSAANIVDRSLDQGSEMADETPTVATVLSESQDSQPYDSKLGFKEDPMAEKKLPEIDELIGASPSSKKVAAFFTSLGLDEALAGAGETRDEPELLIGDDSPLEDHPDLPGGEEPNLPSGTNTSSTKDLSDFHREMRKMNAEERVKEMAPSDKQVKLSEESIRLGSNYGIPNKTDMEQIRKDPEFIAAQESMKPKSTSQRSDDFMAKFVEGSQSDIVRGARGNKSLGITRIPATNGDAQVGFVLANKPLDQSPTTAITYGFGVAPGAEGLLDNQLNKDSFSDYMKRGMSEAKQGKKRKAGEIFEYLPQSKRVIGGTASLGDIVM